MEFAPRGRRLYDSPGDDMYKPERAGFALPDLRVHKRTGAKVQGKAAKTGKAPSKGAQGDPIADFTDTQYPTFDDLGAHPTDSDDPVVKEGAELLLGVDGDGDGD